MWHCGGDGSCFEGCALLHPADAEGLPYLEAGGWGRLALRQAAGCRAAGSPYVHLSHPYGRVAQSQNEHSIVLGRAAPSQTLPRASYVHLSHSCGCAAQRQNEHSIVLGRAAPSQTLPAGGLFPGRAAPSQTLPHAGYFHLRSCSISPREGRFPRPPNPLQLRAAAALAKRAARRTSSPASRA